MDNCGIDLHQDKTYVCILDEEGDVMERTTVRTTRRALSKYFKAKERMRVVMEAGGSSPWVSRLVERCGHEVIVCSPRRVRLIAESTLKTDDVDAEVLARLVRIDPGFLGSVTHRSEEAQRLRSKLTVRTSLVETRTKWINTVKGILRGEGYRVAGGAPKTFPQIIKGHSRAPAFSSSRPHVLERITRGGVRWHELRGSRSKAGSRGNTCIRGWPGTMAHFLKSVP